MQMSSPAHEGRLLTYADALREAVAQEMRLDSRVFLFGLDVDDHKAIQGSTRGLLEEFGAERVFGTPLSEDAMTGVAVGAAIAGMRPIHVHIRMDFLLLCMNQLVNIAAKSSYMYGG
jgi:pyruvate/2-oxoglutarate/acetoin dehydrogenase E1 component